MRFIGRIGPLTMAFALVINEKNKSMIRYAEEKILIG
jgi:trk system potassium uptake protein TrkH